MSDAGRVDVLTDEVRRLAELAAAAQHERRMRARELDVAFRGNTPWPKQEPQWTPLQRYAYDKDSAAYSRMLSAVEDLRDCIGSDLIAWALVRIHFRVDPPYGLMAKMLAVAEHDSAKRSRAPGKPSRLLRPTSWKGGWTLTRWHSACTYSGPNTTE